MPGERLHADDDRGEQVPLGRDHLAHRHERPLHREDLLQLRVTCVDEDLVLEPVDPVVDAFEAGEEAVDETVDHGVHQSRGIVDRSVALDVALAEVRDRRRCIAMQRDEIVVGVEAVHLDEAVQIVVARGTEDDEEDVAVVLVDLRPLVEAPRVLERERVEAEVLAQDLEIGGHGSMHVEPEEVTSGKKLLHPVALEVQTAVGTAVDQVVRAGRLRS